MIETSNALAELDFSAKQPVPAALVHQLIAWKLVAINVVTVKILANIEAIQTVADRATAAQMSARQL